MSELIKSEIIGGWGKATLNSPRSYNALNAEMVTELKRLLDQWEEDASISAVMIDSELEKAFCAGGDVVSLYKLAVAGDVEKASSFFEYEYSLDLKIHEYKKPIVVLGNGIVMGGGVGIMNGASHRIMTDKTVFAMPEVTIGFFPDVGGSYFLSRLKDNMGLFIGATGCRLTGFDCKDLGLCDYVVSEDQLSEIKKRLLSMPLALDVKDDLDAEFEDFSVEKTEKSYFEKNYNLIKEFVKDDSSEVLKEKLNGLNTDEKWFLQTRDSFLNGSPETWYIVEKMLREGKSKSVSECFNMEAKLGKALVSRGNFLEGVRALLVDKDKNPKWNPSSYSEVNKLEIDKIFEEV